MTCLDKFMGRRGKARKTEVKKKVYVKMKNKRKEERIQILKSAS